jgi:hypothetical protein
MMATDANTFHNRDAAMFLAPSASIGQTNNNHRIYHIQRGWVIGNW